VNREPDVRLHLLFFRIGVSDPWLISSCCLSLRAPARQWARQRATDARAGRARWAGAAPLNPLEARKRTGADALHTAARAPGAPLRAAPGGGDLCHANRSARQQLERSRGPRRACSALLRASVRVRVGTLWEGHLARGLLVGLCRAAHRARPRGAGRLRRGARRAARRGQARTVSQRRCCSRMRSHHEPQLARYDAAAAAAQLLPRARRPTCARHTCARAVRCTSAVKAQYVVHFRVDLTGHAVPPRRPSRGRNT
jgi:hypothetical protein